MINALRVSINPKIIFFLILKIWYFHVLSFSPLSRQLDINNISFLSFIVCVLTQKLNNLYIIVKRIIIFCPKMRLPLKIQSKKIIRYIVVSLHLYVKVSTWCFYSKFMSLGNRIINLSVNLSYQNEIYYLKLKWAHCDSFIIFFLFCSIFWY